MWILLLLVGLAPVDRARADDALQPILRASLSDTGAVPGQALQLDLVILVPTFMPEPPRVPGFEVPDVMVRTGYAGPTSETIDGETWSGVIRSLDVTPMTVGRFRIPPQSVVVTWMDPESGEPVERRLETGGFAFEGRAPSGAEGLDPFIAATALSLEERIEGEPEALSPGDAFTRTVTARIEGASPIFLPPLVAPLDAEGLAAYPKEPRLEERNDRGVLAGSRRESVTYVAERGVRLAAPGIRLRWWNLDEDRIEEATLPDLEVAASGLVPPFVGDAQTRRDWALRGGAVAAALALLGLLLHRLGPRAALAWRHAAERRRRSEVYAFRQLASALRERRVGDAALALDTWTSRLPHLDSQARRQLESALLPATESLYGRGEAASREVCTAVLSELASMRRERLGQQARRRARALRPLNPALRAAGSRSRRS